MVMSYSHLAFYTCRYKNPQWYKQWWHQLAVDRCSLRYSHQVHCVALHLYYKVVKFQHMPYIAVLLAIYFWHCYCSYQGSTAYQFSSHVMWLLGQYCISVYHTYDVTLEALPGDLGTLKFASHNNIIINGLSWLEYGVSSFTTRAGTLIREGIQII